ncbi:mitochondrial adenyl nucleotide antiporter [Acrasis kona]|uniref:Mitochondrial adenyl nucleotide antiporter n=1 Tax=Acrasis kona TaxID=1008807 RepID=A0AAW2Z912_9EUKA
MQYVDEGGTARLEDDLRSLFMVMDKNKDSSLCKDEIRDYLKLLKLPSTDIYLDKLFTNMDLDNNGQISFEEFKHFTFNYGKKLRVLFERLDSDNDGKLNPDQAKLILSKLGRDTILQQKDVSYDDCRRALSVNSDADIAFQYWEQLYALESEAVVQETQHLYKNVSKSFFAGAIAGVTSRTITAPIDRLKTKYQITTGKTPNVFTGMAQLYRQDGYFGLYRGNVANIIKVAPDKAIKFATFELSKRTLATTDAELTAAQLFVCGAFSGVVTNATMFPLEVIKTRLQGTPKGTYKGIFDTALQISRKEGRIAPFYRGLAASICSTIPNSGINLMGYELMKRVIYGDTRPELGEEPSIVGLGFCGSISSTFSQTMLYPFSVTKSRLIMNGFERLKDPSLPRATLLGVIKNTIKNEGYKGLYKGFTPHLLKSIPSHGLTFAVYEGVKRLCNII